MTAFSKVVEVRWADIDANQHMRHSAYADLCTHTRLEWLQAAGFGADEFKRQGFGPVLFRESTDYRREVNLGERRVVLRSLLQRSNDGQVSVLARDLGQGGMPPRPIEEEQE